jgi:hypothetical protein
MVTENAVFQKRSDGNRFLKLFMLSIQILNTGRKREGSNFFTSERNDLIPFLFILSVQNKVFRILKSFRFLSRSAPIRCHFLRGHHIKLPFLVPLSSN